MDARTESKDSEETTCTSMEDKYRIKYKRGHGRRNSLITLTDRDTGVITALDTITPLGQGVHGVVRKMHSNQFAVAVKSLRHAETFFMTQEDREEGMIEIERELYFLKRCYPHETPYAFFVWSTDDDKTYSRHPYRLDCRIVMPYIRAHTFKTWIRAANDYDLLAIAIYNIAQELQRIHDLGVLHGDFSARNILLYPNLSVHFIDFSFAYDKTEDATDCIITNPDKCYIAPERVNSVEAINADFAQDVYSFAYFLDELFDLYLSFPNRLAFFQKFPAIECFIAHGKQTAPEKRPPLHRLIQQLAPALCLPAMKLTITELQDIDVKAIVRDKVECCTAIEMNQLLYDLCLHHHPDLVDNIIHFLSAEVPAYQHNRLLDVFSLIVDLKKQMLKLHEGFFADTYRKSIIKQLSSALKFAEAMIHYPDAPLTADLLEAVNHMPSLHETHDVMLRKQSLTSSV